MKIPYVFFIVSLLLQSSGQSKNSQLDSTHLLLIKEIGNALPNETLLHTAARLNYAKLIPVIMRKQHIDVNCWITDSDTSHYYHYWRPLHVAANYNKINAIQALIKNKANINTKNYYGKTPLHLAVYKGHKEAVSLLLAHGADINAQDNKKWTPLHIAVLRGNLEVTQILTANQNIEINSRDNNEETLLHIAVRRSSSTKIVEHLLKQPKIQVGAQDHFGQVPLHLAAFNGFLDTVELLLKAHTKTNVPIKIKDINGRAPIHLASLQKNEKIIEAFLNHNADTLITITAPGKPFHGWTARDLACFFNHLKITKALE